MHTVLWLPLAQDHLSSHEIPGILCTQLPDNLTLQEWERSSSSVEFWALCIWHTFQEVNTRLPCPSLENFLLSEFLCGKASHLHFISLQAPR